VFFLIIIITPYDRLYYSRTVSIQTAVQIQTLR